MTMLESQSAQRWQLFKPQRRGHNDLPPVEQLLVHGGDGRIAIDASSGVNKYGCPPYPDPNLIGLGSSTASVISPYAFAAAQDLWQRLLYCVRAGESRSMTYARELHHIRNELLQLCGIADIPGIEVVFGASGTDLHLMAGRLLEGTHTNPALAVVVDAVETGSGVPAALAGRHFSHCAAMGETVNRGERLPSKGTMQVATVALRRSCGTPRPTTEIDAEVTDLVDKAVVQGRRVLLTLVDVSKTGLIAPSLSCALELRKRWPDNVDVLVDACQFRLSAESVRAYIQNDFMLALTGSKFVTGPTFSGALFFPTSIARRMKGRLLPRALASYASRYEWPRHWAGAGRLSNAPNFGLLLRWKAALEELRAFRSIPDAIVSGFLRQFSHAVTARLHADPVLDSVAVPAIDRQALLPIRNWDQQQTIFPFLLKRLSGAGTVRYLTREETMKVYGLLQQDLSARGAPTFTKSDDHLSAMRFQLGQPVICGERDGVPVSALRICASARMIVEAVSGRGAGSTDVVARALKALDKTVALLS